MIVDKLHQFLNAKGQDINEAILAEVATLSRYAFKRQFGKREEKPGTLRLSSIGRCPRQQAYRVLGFEEMGKSIDARAKMVFFMGDLTELAIVGLAKAAGCDVTASGMGQAEVEIDGVKGHPDGLVRDSGKTYLLEVKSMSSFSFSDFEKGVIDDGYRFQCNGYMEALGLEKTVIVALNKDAGVLAENIISKDPKIVADIKSRIKIIKAATKDNLPERPFAPNERGHLPWPCLYCGWWMTCWPKAQKILVSGRYKLHIPKPKGDTKWDTETLKSSKTASS